MLRQGLRCVEARLCAALALFHNCASASPETIFLPLSSGADPDSANATVNYRKRPGGR